MFRLPQIDPAEEQKRIREDVRNNFVIFAVLCTAIRIAPYILEKINAS